MKPLSEFGSVGKDREEARMPFLEMLKTQARFLRKLQKSG